MSMRTVSSVDVTSGRESSANVRPAIAAKAQPRIGGTQAAATSRPRMPVAASRTSAASVCSAMKAATTSPPVKASRKDQHTRSARGLLLQPKGEPKRQQTHSVFGNQQRVQDAAEHAADAHDRRMRQCRRREREQARTGSTRGEACSYECAR